MINEVVIGIGSNIDPEGNVASALELIGKYLTVDRRSRIIRTAPIGNPNQPDFLNCALLARTRLEIDELKQCLGRLEHDHLGREASQVKTSARTIDLDIIIWNGKIVHQDYRERRFLRELISEILPPETISRLEAV